jgi:CHAT domain-containing protein
VFRFRKYLLVACFALSSQGLLANDLALSGLMQQGKHHELIQALEPRVSAGEDVSSFQLMMLGGAYYEVGKYHEALDTADRLETRIKAGHSSVFGADLSVYPEIIRAAVSLDQGQYDAAARYASAAYAQLKQNQLFYRSQRIQVSSILGIADALAGQPEEARKSLERIRGVNLVLSNLGPEKFAALARVHMALNEYDMALQSITDRSAEVDAVLTLFYDPTFQNLPKFFIRCKSLFETGRVEEAKQGYDELLRHPQIVQFGAMYWIVLYDRARIALKDGDPAMAIELLKKAVDVIEEQRSSINSEAGRIGFVGDKQAVYGRLVALLQAQGRVAEAFDYVERSKSRALVEMLAAKTDFVAPATDPQQVRLALAQLDALGTAAQGKDTSPETTHVAALRSLRTARQKILDMAPELATLVSVGGVPSDDLKALLGRDEALVEYYYHGQDLYAFVLDQRQLRAVKLAGEGLEEQVQALRDAIEQTDTNAWRPIAESLYGRLWQPIEGWVGPAKSVVIVAHGALHYLPFAALRNPGGDLLIDRFGLRFLPSASVLKLLRPAQVTAGVQLLALGNPDLGDSKLDLQFAEGEARTVASLFPDSRLLVRKDASETNFRKAGSAFRRIHFATHGMFRADAPLSSGLFLAKDTDNDGVLTVGELYSTHLNADLVTLSACETGLGKIANGDDIVGLTRGFLYAGARSIVASLWSVDDRATAQLMESFYRNLAHMSKLEALRQAQINTRRAFPHPFFWAAFQLTGRAD